MTGGSSGTDAPRGGGERYDAPTEALAMPPVDEDSRGPHTGATSVAGSTARTPDAAPPSASADG